MKVNIMGRPWSVELKTIVQEPRFSDCDGFCDWSVKKIVVRKEVEGSLEDMNVYAKKVIRHEIVHAFLFECGLGHSTIGVESWAMNEEMVDWVARIGPDIYKAWEKVGAV